MNENQAVSEKKDIKNHELYTEKFKNIKYYREVKKDGNCMYLSICVLLISYLRETPEFKEEWNIFVKKVVDYLKNLGIEELTYIDNLETMEDFISNGKPLEELDVYAWYEIVYFIRLAISAEMRTNTDKYQPFIPDMSIEMYCKKNVEPFYKEAGYIEIGALVEILPFSIEVIDIQEDTVECSRRYGIHDKTLTILHTPNHFEPGYYN